LRAQRRYPEAIPHYETALAVNRNWVSAMFGLGQCKYFTEAIDESISLMKQAIRLSPRDPLIGVWCQQLGLARIMEARNDEAVLRLEKARDANPVHPVFHADLASAYALNGETERAIIELAEARRLGRGDIFTSIARMQTFAGHNSRPPKMRVLIEATYYAGLRKAGMPEE